MENQLKEKLVNKKLGIISLIIGFTNIFVILFNFFPVSTKIWNIALGTYSQVLIYFQIFFCLSLIGLILGLLGLKFSSKKISFWGIVLAILNLIILSILFIFFHSLAWTN
jgi:hypothetical protein